MSRVRLSTEKNKHGGPSNMTISIRGGEENKSVMNWRDSVAMVLSESRFSVVVERTAAREEISGMRRFFRPK